MEVIAKNELPLEFYEAIIERGLDSFLDVGSALLAIRDSNKYKATHATFEDYCEKRWGISVRFAQMQMKAAKVSQVLDANNCSHLPESESVTRPLNKLKDETLQVEAWKEAVAISDGHPTAEDVEVAVETARQRHGGSDPAETRKKPSHSSSKKQPAFDNYAHADAGLDKCQEGMDEMTDPAEFSKLATRLYALYEMAEARAVYKKELN